MGEGWNADIDGPVEETIATNLLGPWRVCKAFLPLLRKSRTARIVKVHPNQDRWRKWEQVRLRIKSRRLL